MTELKGAGATYAAIRNQIQPAVTKAANRGVVKENFVVDLGERPLSEKLRRPLGQYNRRTTTAPITRLWVMSEDGAELEEIEFL
ncbi:hypothetical protein [Salana multivorans]